MLCHLDFPRGAWTTKQYADYLELAQRWAKSWGTQPDVVERVLYSVGKSRPLAVSALSGRPL